ncbi:MAG: hypothetical protein IK999_10630 [Ruminococcus sp.]|nr:hypothetical protein [Ruminococcus sp.]
MKGKLVGAMRRSGRFTPKDGSQEIPYDNIMLNVLEQLPEVNEPDRQEFGEGYRLVTLKIRWKDLFNKLDYGEIREVSDFNQFFGEEIEYFFDSYGNVDSISLIK